jgi:hypothetical protein
MVTEHPFGALLVRVEGDARAVNGLTRAAALETARMGIRINAISPGGVVTPMFQRFTVVAVDGGYTAQ